MMPLNLEIVFQDWLVLFGPLLIVYIGIFFFFFFIILFWDHLTLANFKRFVHFFMVISVCFTVFVFFFSLYVDYFYVLPYVRISFSETRNDWVQLFVFLLLLFLFYSFLYFYSSLWYRKTINGFSSRKFTKGAFFYCILTILTRSLIRLSLVFSATRDLFIDTFFSSFFIIKFTHVFTDLELINLIDSYAAKFHLQFSIEQFELFIEIGHTSVSNMHSAMSQARLEMMRAAASLPVSESWFSSCITSVFNFFHSLNQYTVNTFIGLSQPQKVLAVMAGIMVFVSFISIVAVILDKTPPDVKGSRDDILEQEEEQRGSGIPEEIISYYKERKDNWIDTYNSLDSQQLDLLKKHQPIIAHVLFEIVNERPPLSPLERKQEQLLAFYNSMDFQQLRNLRDTNPALFQIFSEIVAERMRTKGLFPKKPFWLELGAYMSDWIVYIRAFFG